MAMRSAEEIITNKHNYNFKSSCATSMKVLTEATFLARSEDRRMSIATKACLAASTASALGRHPNTRCISFSISRPVSLSLSPSLSHTHTVLSPNGLSSWNRTAKRPTQRKRRKWSCLDVELPEFVSHSQWKSRYNWSRLLDSGQKKHQRSTMRMMMMMTTTAAEKWRELVV